jgi:hypothetical protein
VHSALFEWPKNPPTFKALVTVYNSCSGATPGTSPIPVTNDANICILVQFDRLLEGKSPFSAGSRIVFLVHSPTLLFGGYGFDGKQFVFTVAMWRPLLRHQRFWLKRIEACGPGGRHASD